MTLAQTGNDVAVDLDHMQMIQPLQQRVGQRAQARADLDDAIVTLAGEWRH